MKKLGLLLVVLFALSACSPGPALPRPLDEMELQTVVAATLAAQFPTATRTWLPPTWTHTPAPTSTPRPALTLNAAQVDNSAAETAIALGTPVPEGTLLPTHDRGTPRGPLYYTFVSSGFDSTDMFGLREGEIVLTWAYLGARFEKETVANVKHLHKKKVAELDAWLKLQQERYEGQIQRAMKQRDDKAIRDATEALSKVKAKYQEDLDKENRHYEAELEKYESSFLVKLGYGDEMERVFFNMGPGTGTITLQVDEARWDYHLEVQSYGGWQLWIEQK